MCLGSGPGHNEGAAAVGRFETIFPCLHAMLIISTLWPNKGIFCDPVSIFLCVGYRTVMFLGHRHS